MEDVPAEWLDCSEYMSAAATPLLKWRGSDIFAPMSTPPPSLSAPLCPFLIQGACRSGAAPAVSGKKPNEPSLPIR